MTVHELVAALLTVPNQEAVVVVRMWLAGHEIEAVRIERDTVELIWRDLQK